MQDLLCGGEGGMEERKGGVGGGGRHVFTPYCLCSMGYLSRIEYLTIFGLYVRDGGCYTVVATHNMRTHNIM